MGFRLAVSACALALAVGSVAGPASAQADVLSPSCFRERFNQISPALTEFRLSVPGIDVSTLSATVDGVSVAVSYAASKNEAQLTQAGAASSSIELRYCLPSYSSGCASFGCDANPI